MSLVAIVAAMPGELGPLVRGWRRARRDGVRLWSRPGGAGEWTAACAGAGAAAATRALQEIERGGAAGSIVSVGWAGALRWDFVPGRSYRVSGVTDARTGERFPCAWPGECWLVTSPRVAGAADKATLAAEFGADLVDMEAAALARLAAARGIPFYCLKGVSDGPADRLPDFNRFFSGDGRFRLARFTLFALVRPWHWDVLARMGRNSRKSAQSIGESLLSAFDGQGMLRTPEGRPGPGN